MVAWFEEHEADPDAYSLWWMLCEQDCWSEDHSGPSAPSPAPLEAASKADDEAGESNLEGTAGAIALGLANSSGAVWRNIRPGFAQGH